VLPAGSITAPAGTKLDAIGLAFNAAGDFLDATCVVRVTF
jgi:hypothetical protein